MWSTGCSRACCVSGRGAKKIEVKQVQKEISTNGEAVERGFLQQYAVVLCYLKSLRLRITQSSGAVLKIEVDVSPGLPVASVSPCGLCGRKATLEEEEEQLISFE